MAAYSTFFNEAPTTSSNLLNIPKRQAVSRSVINGGKERTITFIEGPNLNKKHMGLYLLAVKVKFDLGSQAFSSNWDYSDIGK